MGFALKIIDKVMGGKETVQPTLYLASERVTAKELIEARVRQEVDAYNKSRPEHFNGLVRPEGAEAALNGYKMKTRRTLDPEKQCEIALSAFNSNGFFILADEIQVSSPDDEIILMPETKITFIKLVPLAGG